VIYQPNQVSNIYAHIDFRPEWFILGGPADGDEAQRFKKKYPKASILGLEPDPAGFAVQQKMKFPGTLLPCGLGDKAGTVKFDSKLGIRRGSVTEEGDIEVHLTTLDELDVERGPFNKAVLWLDIEGYEMQALVGATKLLTERRIWLINLEIIELPVNGLEVELSKFTNFLADFGYSMVHVWNEGHLDVTMERYRRDVVFKTKR
jgi:FkbM family methyltransferase